MLKIFVDTCVWRHWLSLRSNSSRLQEPELTDAGAFAEIIAAVNDQRLAANLIYDQGVIIELGPVRVEEISALLSRQVERVPIPQSRCDGRYRYDGSLLAGGEFGGSLDAMLNADGRRHEELLHAAFVKSGEAGTPLFEQKARIAEFDVEHLEAALEAGADIFMTTDRATILDKLPKLANLPTASHAVKRAAQILRSPSQFVEETDLTRSTN